jgi:pimeloyl-ACP methyl ester carboxylesterase
MTIVRYLKLVLFPGWQSYGTILGQYFATLYPDKIGRLVLE